MLDYKVPELKERVVKATLSKQRGRAETLMVYTWFGPAKNQDLQNEKTIVILPGLDDSVFQYEKAFNWIRSLNPDYSILGIDLKGQGKTCDADQLTSFKAIDLSTQEEIIKTVLKEYGIEKKFLMGLSYGAGVALHFAVTNPENVLGLGLIAPYVSEFKAYKPGLPGLFYFLSAFNPFLPKITPYSLPFYFLNARLKGTLNPGVKWTTKKMRALTRLTLGVLKLKTDQALDELAHLPAGVHLLCACQDTVVPIGAHRHFYNRIPGSMDKSFSLEEGIGHRVLSEHPKQAARWLNRILP